MAVLALLLLSFGCSDDETGTHDPSAPVVVDQFYPKTGGVGTELIITGSNFSADPSQVSVKIGETSLVVLNSDVNNIVAIVPPKLGSGPFEISIAGGEPVRTEESFSYIYSAVVSTLAGTGETGFANGSGDAAMFNFKSFDGNGWMKGSICADEAGNVYVADIHNCLIRKIMPDGTVSTLAGALGVNENLDGVGASAHVSNMVYGMDCDAEGNVWFVDTGSWLLRKVTPDGVVTTEANCPFQPWYIRIDRKNGVAYLTAQDGSTGLYQYDMKSGEFRNSLRVRPTRPWRLPMTGHSTSATRPTIRSSGSYARATVGRESALPATGRRVMPTGRLPRRSSPSRAGWLSTRWETFSWPETVRGT